jgi:hypothetical protein
MSKGRGRIARISESILTAEPDNAFTIEDLCGRVYDADNPVEKNHRVAVIRAAKRIASRNSNIGTMTIGGEVAR